MLLTMLDSVYIDAKEEKRVVAIKPKPPFRPVFQVAATKAGAVVVLDCFLTKVMVNAIRLVLFPRQQFRTKRLILARTEPCPERCGTYGSRRRSVR